MPLTWDVTKVKTAYREISKEEYDALAPGTEYEGEDGEIYLKPGGPGTQGIGLPQDPGQPAMPDIDFLENLMRGNYG